MYVYIYIYIYIYIYAYIYIYTYIFTYIYTGFPLVGADSGIPPPAKILTNPPSLKFCPSPLMSPSTWFGMP